MNLLTQQALVALLAGAAVGFPGNLGTECESIHYDYEKYQLQAPCSDTDSETLDVNKCFKNDNGYLAWEQEYVNPLGRPLVKSRSTFLIYLQGKTANASFL